MCHFTNIYFLKKKKVNSRKFDLFGKNAYVYLFFISLIFLALIYLYLCVFLGATQIMNMTNLLTYAWGTPRFLNKLICQTMLDLSHDIVLHAYMSNMQFDSLCFEKSSINGVSHIIFSISVWNVGITQMKRVN